MKARVAVAAACAVVISSLSLQAHHGYADFKQDKVISVQGTVERVDWANPHTTLMIKSNDTTYTAVWENRYHLHRNRRASQDVTEISHGTLNPPPTPNPKGSNSSAPMQYVRRPFLLPGSASLYNDCEKHKTKPSICFLNPCLKISDLLIQSVAACLNRACG